MTTKRVYWDSCVFIDRLQRSPDKIVVLEELTDAARAAKLIIVASTLCIAETVKIGTGDAGSKSQSESIFKFFENPWIELVQVDFEIAKLAHEISRDYGVKPADAIHVATAIKAKVEVLHTYDGS